MKKLLQDEESTGTGRRFLLSMLIFVFSITTATAQSGYWQQRVNHRIDVTLNDDEHTLDGFERIEYANRSPDTLHYIWFHIWPNAFKNDKTAFSEQLLLNGKTDFYFANKESRGYINRLDFKVNGSGAKTEDHPQYIDVIRLILPEPLAPGKTAVITTPFHVKLPYNFSRGGHRGQAYQVTQWFPKPAVYDRNGWHPMPYLDQGEFYSEFGDYDVRITLPANYVIAATGELTDEKEKAWLSTRIPPAESTMVAEAGKPVEDSFPQSSAEKKTVRYLRQNIHDFAWFADKRFLLSRDTVSLSSGKTINLNYYAPADSKNHADGISFMREAVRSRSGWLGEYPYETVSVVETETGVYGGMEYPAIASISPVFEGKELDLLIAHEIGHNWLHGILANNERRYPWMDEGMNSYYDERYEVYRYGINEGSSRETFANKRFPADRSRLHFETLAGVKKDQPVNTSSQEFNAVNYELSSYYKAAEWLKLMERKLGKTTFDQAMKTYYETWKFRHPMPEDFQQVMESASATKLDSIFQLLDRKGTLVQPGKKKLKLTTWFNLKETDKYHYLSVAPAAGYNRYDGVMIGLLVHNFQLPLNRLQFLAVPLYATRAKTLNGLGRISYSQYPDNNRISKWEVGVAASHFTMDDLDRGEEGRWFLKFTKVAPFVKINFYKSPLSQLDRHLQLKGFFIREDDYDFRQQITGTDTSEVIRIVSGTQAIGELRYVAENTRALYPYRAEFAYQQHRHFARLAFTGNYFFNYASTRGGIRSRVFAGKFLYTGSQEKFSPDRFLLNLTGPKGDEDYTYSEYFLGRNEFENWQSQQIMLRDGAFKVGTDLLSDKVGKTGNWLVASNFIMDVPAHLNPLKVLPVKIPLKIFADFGTYAEAWDEEAEHGRFLFDAGFQFSFFKETLNIYLPILYSRVYRDYYRSMYGNKYFFNTISFSFNFSGLSTKKVTSEFQF